MTQTTKAPPQVNPHARFADFLADAEVYVGHVLTAIHLIRAIYPPQIPPSGGTPDAPEEGPKPDLYPGH